MGDTYLMGQTQIFTLFQVWIKNIHLGPYVNVHICEVDSRYYTMQKQNQYLDVWENQYF